ncbi:GDP-mannose 4,6-dehydratase [Patulibacter sp. NPDC049589]|uniref:GDP-mannose 4,6-dehydratase n=1 Tax=Patulibacter sp. NPDC049589 TaxID=3154731 RepID=UPI00344AFDF2
MNTQRKRPPVKRALVTGCAGFIGSHLTESLLADGVDVVGVDCFNANYGRSQKLANLANAREWDSFDFVPVDLSRGELDELVDGVDTVFHLAAEPGVRASWGDNFQRYVQNNLVATQHLLNAVARAGTPRIVYASSSSVYGQAKVFPTTELATPAPQSPYGMTKLSGEHLCYAFSENFDVETVSLRFFTVFGPRQRPDMAFNIFSKAALAGEPIVVYGDGHQTRDFTFVSDIVAATRSAATSAVAPGSVYNLGGGVRSSLREVLGIIDGLNGGRVDVTYSTTVPGDVRDTAADTSRARRDLGFAPAVSLSEGLEREFEWLRGQIS